jgi:hypothetical protein
MKVRACGEYPHLSVLTVTFEVFLSAIAGYVPSAMVRCIAAFMDACYIARRNAIDSSSLEHFQDCVRTYHDLRTIFLEAGLNIKLSVPRQHALSHFYQGIHLFGSPNGLCSSITESKHIEAVKKTWRRSSRYRALTQMLRTIQRMDKMQALQRRFEANGMLRGFGFSPDFGNTMDHDTDTILMDDSEEHEDEDKAVVSGESKDVSEFDVQLAARNRAYCVTDRPVTRRKKVTFDKNAKVQALVQGAQAFKEKMLALEAEAEIREEQQALARAVSTRQYAVVRRTGSVTGRARTT